MSLLFTVLLCLTFLPRVAQSSDVQHADLNPLLKEFARTKDLCHVFLLRKMRNSEGGFYSTYLKSYPNSSFYGVNHEVTSESTGLAMEYAINSGNFTLFNEQYEFLRKYQIGRLGTTYWKLNPDLAPFRNFNVFSSALIDDLRIINSLITGYEVLKKTEYLELAKIMINGIKGYETENGLLAENLDWTTVGTCTRSETTILGYLDLKALLAASQYEQTLAEAYSSTLKLILGAQFSTTGLFYERYNISSKKYFNPEARTSTTLQLLTALHLSEAGFKKEANIPYVFLKETFLKDGAIASSYVPFSGDHTEDELDTGSYSLCAMLATSLGDKDFSSLVLKTKVLTKQCLDRTSQLYGAFVTTWPGEILDANSWDNLLAINSIATLISALEKVDVDHSIVQGTKMLALLVGISVVAVTVYVLKRRDVAYSMSTVQ